MLINGATINGQGGGFNESAPQGTSSFESEVNAHPFNGVALNGGQPTVTNSSGIFSFNGAAINAVTVNGAMIQLGSGGATDSFLDGGIAGYGDDFGENDVIVGVVVPLEAGEQVWLNLPDIPTDPTIILGPIVEIDVFAENAQVIAAPIVINVSGRGIVSQVIQINVALPSAVIEAPIEINVAGVAEIELPIAINVFDVDAFAVSGGSSLVWTTTVTLKGVDVSTALTGKLRIEAEEGTARIASFVLKPASGPVQLTDWVGAAVTIDFIATDNAGTPLATTRIFTGIVDVPDYDPGTRTTKYTCTDNFQQRVETSSREQIDGLIGGRWTPFIFDRDADNWTYMQDQLSTVSKSFELSAFAQFRSATPWAAKGTADYTYDDTFALDDSVRVELESARDILGEYVVSFDYSYERLRKREIAFTWAFPGRFCDYLDPGTKTLPRKTLIESAAERSGWTLQSIQHEDLPPSQLITCNGADRIWVNTENGFGPLFTLRSTGVLIRRFAQSVKEQYAISVLAPDSPFSDVKKSRRFRVESDYDTDSWENSEFPPESNQIVIDGSDDSYEDRDEEPVGNRAQMQTAQEVAIDIAKTEIRNAHRQNRVGFSISMAPQLDLVHTVELVTAAVQAKGKVAQLVWTMDIDKGTAITQVVVAVSNSTAVPVVETPTEPADRPDTVSQMTASTNRPALGTRYGGDLEKAPDPAEPFAGWSSNLTPADAGAPIIEEKFQVFTDEVVAQDRDEIEAETVAQYLVNIPNETLILFT